MSFNAVMLSCKALLEDSTCTVGHLPAVEQVSHNIQHRGNTKNDLMSHTTRGDAGCCHAAALMWQASHSLKQYSLDIQHKDVQGIEPFKLRNAGLVLAAAMVALSCGDMHYTARYFHERTETILGAVLGLLAFQIPVAWWLLYGFTIPYTRR